ncbi:MAG: ATP-binding cassette domain-containing protein, partial [Bacteroidota bacterium]
MLKAVNITKNYSSLKVVKAVNLSMDKGEIVAIVGSSGAGKSTLLHILGTLDKPDSGDIILNNTILNKLSNKALSKFRNKHIGFIFQFHHLLPEFTAIENVCIPAWIAGTSKKQSLDRATELLERLGLGDRMQHKPSTLSGG